MSEYTFPTRTDATSTATAGKDYLIYLNTRHYRSSSDLDSSGWPAQR